MRLPMANSERTRLFGYFLISFVLIALLVLSFEVFMIIKTRIDNGINENEFYASRALAFDGKYTTAELREMAPLVGDHLKYRPWVQFGNYDHSNKYSVVENGIRKSIDPRCRATRLTAWFFGGSTMYGVGVPWWDSIPSQFVRHAQKRGICVIATNYGVPYFYSTQEAVYFYTELIRTRETPTFAIFLDGFNDFAQPGSSIKIEPFFTPVLDEAIPYGTSIQMSSLGPSFLEKLETYRYIRETLFRAGGVKASSRNFIIPNMASEAQHDSIDSAAKEIVTNYRSTRTLLKAICTDQKIKCVQFLQPIAIKDYHPPAEDTLTERFRKADARLYRAGYEYLLEQSLADMHHVTTVDYGISFFDISDTLSAYEGIAYVDAMHYTPRAIDGISKRMVDIVFEK